jgi:hypothetical protein
MFMLYLIELPKGVSKSLGYYGFHFFWQDDKHKIKSTPIIWKIICGPKEQGGLRVEVVDIENKCLLSK